MASEDKNSGAGDKKPTYLQMSLDAIKEDNSKGGTSKQVYVLSYLCWYREKFSYLN